MVLKYLLAKIFLGIVLIVASGLISSGIFCLPNGCFFDNLFCSSGSCFSESLTQHLDEKNNLTVVAPSFFVFAIFLICFWVFADQFRAALKQSRRNFCFLRFIFDRLPQPFNYLIFLFSSGILNPKTH